MEELTNIAKLFTLSPLGRKAALQLNFSFHLALKEANNGERLVGDIR